jgi:hypothetical protein
LERVFTIYLFGASALSISVRGFIFVTPDMKMGGGFGSALWLGESSRVSSVSALNRLLVGIVTPNSQSFWRLEVHDRPRSCIFSY